MDARGRRGIGVTVMELAAGSMLQRATLTLMTAALLTGLFGIYAAATASLKPGPPQSEPEAAPGLAAPDAAPDDSMEMSQKFLAAQQWAETAIFRGQTHDGGLFYYFNDYEQIADNVMRFVPFAMIIKPKDAKHADERYTVVSDSADVTFASKVSFPMANPGPALRAGLRGKVTIHGPNQLIISGRDFSFDREAKRVYSDLPVRFQFDRHRGSAKGVQLELVEQPGGKGDAGLGVSGISSAKLLQDVEMILAPEPPKPSGKEIERHKRAPVPGHLVHIHSDGSFNFVLATRVATFERNVNIRRETEAQKSDRLFADQRVEIAFDDKKPVPPAANTPGKESADPAKASLGGKVNSAQNATRSIDPNLSFKSVHAEGKVVTLISEEHEIRATMRELRYDQLACEAILSGGADRVRVLHRGDRLRSPWIRLNHDAQGGAVTHVWCRGAGDMVHIDEKSREVDLNVEWRKEMRKYPEPDSRSPFDRIDLEEAIVEQPRESSGIAANHMRLWIVRDMANRPAIASRTPSGPTNPEARLLQNAPRLDHMLAWQNVAMVSPQMEAETKRLEAWFEPPDPAVKKPVTTRPSRANLAPTGMKVAPPTSVAAAGIKPQTSTAIRRSGALGIGSPGGGTEEPYNLNADLIRVRIRQGADEKAQLTQVVAEGSTYLTQSHGDQESPLIIDGNRIDVQNRSDSDQDMIVTGQPAHVRDRGSVIQGNRIRFNRLQNTADVEGVGRLQLPMKRDQASPNSPARPLDVVWLRRMHFNGKTAEFFGSVRTTMNDFDAKTEVRCQTMVVTLDQAFSFTQPQKKSAAPGIEQIACSGGVQFESESLAEGRVMEVRRGNFTGMTFHHLTGESQAEGPGLLRVWRHTENGRSGISQLANVRSNSAPKERKSTAWEFMQITFDGRMQAHRTAAEGTRLQSQQPTKPAATTSSILGTNGSWTSTFYDNVQVLYGPVDRLSVTVNRDDLDDQSGWMRSETLEVAQHPQTKSADAHVTLKADHNAQIEGKEYRGEAETITYDGSKSQYRLHGDNNRRARLWRQVQVGGDPSESNAYIVIYNTQTREVKLEGAGTINASR